MKENIICGGSPDLASVVRDIRRGTGIGLVVADFADWIRDRTGLELVNTKILLNHKTVEEK